MTRLHLLLAGLLAFQSITFKSGVDLVRVDISVLDENGRPITDLRQDEIAIVEDGVPLPLVLFQRVTEPADAYVEAATRAVTAEVSSNEAFPRGHLYILVFDQTHITPGNEHRARVAAEQFIRTRVRPSDRVALFAVPGPGPQIGFTPDKTRALAELSKIRGTYSRQVSTALGTMTIYEAHRVVQNDDRLTSTLIGRMNAEAGLDAIATPPGGRGGGAATDAVQPASISAAALRENARTVVSQSDAESRQFLQRLADVITAMGEIEGRKSVVLFSEGFFQDNLSRELEAVAAAAAQTYSVFYAIDLNARTPSVTETAPSETALGTELQARIAPLGTLAAETNGALIFDAAARSDRALNQLADQAQDYYLVGFMPSESARTNRGKYHRISVKVSRPGARVTARTGYALKQDSATNDRRRSINAVLGAPFVQQGLKVDYTTYVMKGSAPGQQRVLLSLNADLPVRGRADDRADVVFVARDVQDGRVVASGTDTILLPERAAPGKTLGTAAWRVQFDVPAGSYIMRAVVREPGGLSGSADRRIDVRSLGGPDISASDLVLGSSGAGVAVRAQAYTEDGLSGVVDAYARSTAQLEAIDVKLELRRADGGAAVAFPGELAAAQEDSTGATRRASFVVPLRGVPPGSYVAHAIVRARGEVVAERTRHLDVIAGRAPVALEPSFATAREIVDTPLAKKYIASLAARAANTPWAEAAGHAQSGRWEAVEASLARRIGEGGGAGTANVADVPHALRGLALFAREEYAGASTALALAAAANKTEALTYFYLGWAQEGARDTRAAIGSWRFAAVADPKNVSTHLAIAEAYLRLSEPALAVQALRAGLAAVPTSVEIQQRLQQLERRQE